jgi:rSAM/selenodomain-associated transferase 1
MTVHCAIFLQVPRAGQVKPRLAAEIGDSHALRLYRIMAARAIAAITEAGYRPVIWYAPADGRQEMVRWLGADIDLRLQASGDMGVRLAAAVRSAADGEPWLALSGDCPALEAVHIREAVERLEDWPVVLGPALDGDCYLIGGIAPLPDLWSEMPWGTHRVLDETRRRLESLRIRWTELPALRDVETADDARAAGLLT